MDWREKRDRRKKPLFAQRPEESDAVRFRHVSGQAVQQGMGTYTENAKDRYGSSADLRQARPEERRQRKGRHQAHEQAVRRSPVVSDRIAQNKTRQEIRVRQNRQSHSSDQKKGLLPEGRSLEIAPEPKKAECGNHGVSYR